MLLPEMDGITGFYKARTDRVPFLVAISNGAFS